MVVGEKWAHQAAQLVQKHPRRLTAIVGTCLLAAGSGAFAVASFAPDPSDMPVREVLQAIEPMVAALPDDVLDAHRFRLFRTETVRSSDTAISLLQRLGVDDTTAAAFLRTDANAKQGLFARAGRTVHAETSNTNQLL